MHPAERLATSLEDLRLAALHGDFAKIDHLAGHIADGVAGLADLPPDEAELKRLMGRAADLTVLLRAAGEGLAAARRRLAEIEAVRRGLGTYGRDGQRRTLGALIAASRRL
jgi:hypothetical protein